MDVFKKDMILKQIANEIKNNKKDIGNSVSDLYELKNKNSHLRELYDEKKQCHNTIVNLKKDQKPHKFADVEAFIMFSHGEVKAT